MPRDNQVVRGNSVEEKLRSIDAALATLNRRDSIKKFNVAPSVIPISACALNPVPGNMLIRFLFPVDGKITQVYSWMKGRRTSTITLNVDTESSGSSKTLEVGDGLRSVSAEFNIKAGDMLSVFYEDSSLSAGALEVDLDIALSLLFVVDVPKQDMKKILTSEV